MKAFEKWDDHWCPKMQCELKRVKCQDCKDLRKAGFRTALEWVLKTEKELEEQDAPIGMREVIEQELRD